MNPAFDQILQFAAVKTDLDLNESNILITNNFHNLQSWEDYHDYMNSNYSKEIEKPPSDLFSYKEFHGVAT